MKNEDILTWLTKFGMDWVGLFDAYYAFTDVHEIDFWVMVQEGHDSAYLTKRLNRKHYEEHIKHQRTGDIEQYRLTQKALRQLELDS